MNTQTNKPLTVEEAASADLKKHLVGKDNHYFSIGHYEGFNAGSAWQKEQGFIKWYSVEKDGVPKYDPAIGILVPLLLYHIEGQRYKEIENGYYHHHGIGGRFVAKGGYELNVTHYAYFNYPE